MKTTEENNRMIAEFMGASGFDMLGEKVEPKYHTSWDWLMPVASKLYFESSKLNQMKSFRMSHIIQTYQSAVVNNEIDIAHKYICDGINLLNKQKP